MFWWTIQIVLPKIYVIRKSEEKSYSRFVGCIRATFNDISSVLIDTKEEEEGDEEKRNTNPWNFYVTLMLSFIIEL